MSEKRDYSLLMIKGLAGDSRAYGELLEESERIVRSYLFKRIKNFHDIDDVIQDILLSIHKARHTYDGNRPYEPWLYAIANYRLQDYLRKHYADPLRFAGEITEVEAISAENITSYDVTKTGISYEEISGEVEKLKGKQPQILRMLHKDGHTIKEVAEKINMNESAVKVAAHRAYKVLRKKLR